MAEAHPLGFRWPLKAQAGGAKLIHVDPRFTRTSAMCDVYVPITIAAVVDAIRADKTRLVDFMRRFELGLEEPDPKRARNSALTIALSYIAGGMVPLAPCFFIRSVHTALLGSVVVALLAVLVFGYVKGRFTTAKPFRSAWQTVVVGGLAATAAFVIAKAIG